MLDVGQWGRSLAAELADRTTLSTLPDEGLLLHLRVRSADTAPVPPVELLFQPVNDTEGDLVIAPARVARESDRALTAGAAPQLEGDGSWRVWCTIGGTATPPTVELPWTVHRSGRDLTVTRAD